MRSLDTLEIQEEVAELYKYLPETKRLLKSLGCTSQIAEDIFQEALIILIERKRNEEFEFSLEPIFYLKQTCKFLWFNEARKNQKQAKVFIPIEVDSVEQEWLENELKFNLLEDALKKVGAKCRELFHLFYGLGYRMAEIAKKLDFRNDKVAKVQKYLCIQKAKEQVNLIQQKTNSF